MVINAVLAIAKLLAGILGHSYALVADAIESTSDVLASLIVCVRDQPALLAAFLDTLETA